MPVEGGDSPRCFVPGIGEVRQGSLLALLRFYHIAQMLFAPNQELVDLLEEGRTSRAI
jgi:hypothetical protein